MTASLSEGHKEANNGRCRCHEAGGGRPNRLGGRPGTASKEGRANQVQYDHEIPPGIVSPDKVTREHFMVSAETVCMSCSHRRCSPQKDRLATECGRQVASLPHLTIGSNLPVTG